MAKISDDNRAETRSNCCFSWVVDCDDDDGYEKQKKKKDKGTEVPVV